MVTGGLAEEPRPILNRAAFLVPCTIIKPPDSGEGDGACAHRAGLQRDIKVAIRKPLGSERLAGRPNDLHFRMGSGIVQFQGPVAVSRQNLAVFHQNCANRNFSASCGKPCLFKRQIHEGLAELFSFARHGISGQDIGSRLSELMSHITVMRLRRNKALFPVFSQFPWPVTSAMRLPMTKSHNNNGDRARRAGGRSSDPASKGRRPEGGSGSKSGPRSGFKAGPKSDSRPGGKPGSKFAGKPGAKPGGRPGGKPAGKPKRSTGSGPRPQYAEEARAGAQVDTGSAFEGERIAKVMARVGLCSRREAEAWVLAGRVVLNGKTLDTPAVTVSATDTVLVDGTPLPMRERTRLWLYHKPRGLVTTNKDPEGRPTVFDRLPDDLPRVLTVGRLDINTEGLLLLTNDGGLARVLELPATGWLRRYRVRAFGKVTQADLDTLADGVAIEGILYAGIEATLDKEQGDNCWLTVGLREGKNREVKKVLEHLGLTVNRLIRLSFGPFQLQDLGEGHVREIRGRVLRDQLGEKLAEESGADFDAPILHQPKAEEPARSKKPAGARDDRGGKSSEARWLDKRDGEAAVNRKKPGGQGGAGKPRRDGGTGTGFRRDREDTRSFGGEERSFRSRPARRIWSEDGLVEDKQQDKRDAERREQRNGPGGGRSAGGFSGGGRPSGDRPQRDRSSSDRPGKGRPDKGRPDKGRPDKGRPERGSRPRGRS